MHVQEFGEFGRDSLEAFLKACLSLDLLAGLNGCRLAFNVGKNGGDLRDLFANFRFQASHAVVGFFEWQLFVHF